MQPSWKLGELAGIAVHVHWTFLILPAGLAMASLAAGGSLASVLATLMFVLAVFGCVIAHELGHALAARRYGIATRDITLLPIGGIARLERMPERPEQELVVALAGPAVNAVMAAALFAGMSVFGGLATFASGGLVGGPFLVQVMWANVVLLVFNLLPAFPMDGGRVLRALLATRLSYNSATRIAATIGQAMAVVLGVVGLLFNWMLALVAAFVYFAARAEARAVEMRSILEGNETSGGPGTWERLGVGASWPRGEVYRSEATVRPNSKVVWTRTIE